MGTQAATATAEGPHVATSMRTCIGCRRRTPAAELVRLVAVEGKLRPGPRAGRAGRGASIHPSEACVVTAFERKAFSRAFRAPVVAAGSSTSEPNGNAPGVDAAKAFVREVEIAYISQQPRSR